MNKELILKASFKLIQKIGLEGFSMRKLAEALECKPASIYHYYNNKNDILNDLYTRINKLFFDNRSSSQNLEDYLFDMCKSVQKYNKEYIFLLRYSRSGFLNSENKTLFNKHRDDHIEKLREFIGCSKNNIATHLIMMGSIMELAFIQNKYVLKNEEIRELVKRICIAVRSEIDETIV